MDNLNLEAERKLFEAAMRADIEQKKLAFPSVEEALDRSPSGYSNRYINAYWYGWQAARSAVPAQGVPSAAVGDAQLLKDIEVVSECMGDAAPEDRPAWDRLLPILLASSAPGGGEPSARVAVPSVPTEEWLDAVIRAHQPHLAKDCKAWRDLKAELEYWHAGIVAAAQAQPQQRGGQ